MFPTLFKDNNIYKFQCETCELSKYHRVSFSPNTNKSAKSFALVYTDVWGPSSMVSSSSYWWFFFL
jgi:hypothetical protein